MDHLALVPFFPHTDCVDYLTQWTDNFSLKIVVTRSRKTKLGDYRFAKREQLHLISINNDLNHNAFWFVLTHEIAHMHTFDLHGHMIKPHGREWKQCFAKLLKDSIHCYSPHVQEVLPDFLKKPSAALKIDSPFAQSLGFHSKQGKNKEVLGNFEKGSIFKFGKWLVFKKTDIR